MKVIINAKTGQIVDHEAGCRVVGFISWRRLAEVMRAAKEVRPNETPVTYRLDERGITFAVDTK